jgi:hypothetical protein
MSRFHTTSEGNIPFTAEEEAQRDSEEAAFAVMQEELARTKYRRDRATEYPAIGDQLDALFHAGVFPADMAATLQAVKNKYPKG